MHPRLRLTQSYFFAGLGVTAVLLTGACSEAGSPTGPQENPGIAPSFAAQAIPAAIPDQYIVRFSDDVPDAPGLAKQLVAQHGGKLGFTYSAAFKGFSAQLPAQAVAALERNPNIQAVEPDLLAQVADSQVNPPSWGLDRADQRALPLDKTYRATSDGAGVSVYILDTGIRITHADFGGRAYSAFTAINDGNGTNDCHSHGTHVAGTVGGSSYGIAKQVRLYAVRVMDCNGSGSYSGIIAGIDWVTKNGNRPAVVNMSLGGAVSGALTTAVQNSVKAGVTFAIAAGNSSVDACNVGPANVPEALTVGATTSGDARASYSNFGPCVDIFAPGTSIVSTMNGSDVAYGTKSGTSMASPHVAGAAALYLSMYPSATPAQVASALTTTATSGLLSSVGTGSPNLLLHTVFAAGAPLPPPPPPPPTEPLAPVDQPPVASISSSCPKGACTFNGSGSTDDRGVVSYAWSFGDGTSGTGAVVTHQYKAKGSYVVKLTVTDAAGQSATAQKTVKITRL